MQSSRDRGHGEIVGSRRIDLQIDRLYWRAGFGPSAADRARARRDGVARDARAAPARRHGGLRGTPARIDGGTALQPYDRYGHDVLWWLDRMVRTTAPLAERMAFNLHDHFATSNDKVGDARADAGAVPACCAGTRSATSGGSRTRWRATTRCSGGST